jgi:acetolactate synthase-1/2/3 large subunit
VVLTINAKGVLPPGHPLSLGSTLPQPALIEELAAADVVLAVGTELGETDTLLFGGRPKLGGKLIRIDIDAEQLTRNRLPDLAILSDAAAALAALADRLGDFTPGEDGAMRAKALRARLNEQLDAKQRIHQRVFATLRAALPDVIVVGDSTQPIYSANLFYEPERPRSYFNSSTGYGTLGYALPAALGAKLARRERPVVAVIGDGGLQFTIGELATAVELALPLPVLVWNNRGYSEIKRYMAERGIPQIGVDIYTPDFLAIARGFGCAAARAESLEELSGLLQEANQRPGPTVIEIDEADALEW